MSETKTNVTDVLVAAGMLTEDEVCQRCRCCTTFWIDCESCDEGFDGHDCGEDSCCCLYPEENRVCDFCEGKGGYYACSCNAEGVHEKRCGHE